jgi:dolichol-phosphate mannosyltransferase
MFMQNKISILLPVFNEEANIEPVYFAINKVFKNLPEIEFEVIFVDDGSTDNTLAVLEQLSNKNNNVFFLSFSRNFGKDNALMAGLKYSTGDALITMDADLQHPPEMIPQLIAAWKEGYEVVYTYRENKNEHADLFNQISSKLFYNTVNKLSEVHLENGIADFRILDRKVVNVIANLSENNPFFRGLVKWVGFKQKAIPYTPNSRENGETKYSKWSLMNLAMTGITSFSTKPLSFAIYLGFFFSFASLLYIPYAVYSIYAGLAISGWASIIVTIAFFGGLQLMILGIIGLYLGKSFMQSKERPRYIISSGNVRKSEKKESTQLKVPHRRNKAEMKPTNDPIY